MLQYKELVKDILENGVDSNDRTGVGTKAVFGRQIRFDLSKGFPLVTLKKTYWKGAVIELLWMLQGQTNTGFLEKHGVTIWREWQDENGDLGKIYGKQFRAWEATELIQSPIGGGLSSMSFKSIDQIKWVINEIKTNPNSRRLIVSAWNVGDLPYMYLQPCHCFFQFHVSNNKLSCQLYQRSADVFLGVPFNIASYSLLTHLIANECGLEVGEFIHTFGNAHLYNNHLEQAKEMISREPMELPRMEININPGSLMSFIDEDSKNMNWEEIKEKIKLVGYKSHSGIKAEVAI